MKENMEKIRGLGLSSGGLDSILAAFLLKRQGIEVAWISFETPFFKAEKAEKASKAYEIPFMKKDITALYFPMLRNPESGYGKGMNPCRDCHALMFREAGGIMEDEGFDFLFSGEVLGQRPMSQTGSSMRYVEKKSGFAGRILRPLSAKLLPPTMMEEKGLVNRSMLLDLQGRGRKPQMALAREWGVADFPAPAGGCILTEAVFSSRLRDLFDHEETVDASDCELLKAGRHFRLSEKVKLVIGRTQADNRFLERFYDPLRFLRMETRGIPGPLAYLSGAAPQELLELAAGLVAGYTKAGTGDSVTIHMDGLCGKKILEVLPIRDEEYQNLMIR